MISYNRIEDNNIQNDPNLGGSGIAFSGGSSTSHQNTIVTGNIFSGNLWGITIFRQDAGGVPISGAMPNLGNLNNADTTDDGKNYFINNTNATTPGIDLYNNSSDPIFAMGNYWNTNVEAEVENKIFHQADNSSLGLVTYSSFILPIKLLSFTARAQDKDVLLQWQTAHESNSAFFVVEKSYNGLDFSEINKLPAAGSSNTSLRYNTTDLLAGKFGGNVYYRIKMTDADGSFTYSSIAVVAFEGLLFSSVIRSFPTELQATQTLTVEIASHKKQPVQVQYFDVEGRLLGRQTLFLAAGYNKLNLSVSGATRGWIAVKIATDIFKETLLHLRR